MVRKSAIVGAGFASLAMGHSRHMKRGTIPADGKIWTSCVTPGVVALTFDDGPYIYTETIVDKLTAAGHRATFFQNGQNYDTITNYADVLKKMIAGGHQVASHTWSHADLSLPETDVTEQMTLLEQAHLSIIGKAPTYMRPPYLALSDSAIVTLKSLGYKIISVDIDTKDYEEGPAGRIQNSINWYEGNQTTNGGTISLNHDPFPTTANEFLTAIIEYLGSKGLKSVPVGECIGDDAANWYKGGSVSSSSSKAPSSASSTKPPTSGTPPAGSGTAGPKPSVTGGYGGGPSGKPSGSGPDKPVESGKPGGEHGGSGPDKPTESGKPGGEHGGSGPDKPTESGKPGGGYGGSGPDKPTESGKPGYGDSGKPGSGKPGYGDSGKPGSGKPGSGPACGGDTEEGHGSKSGPAMIPKHAGERNQYWGSENAPWGASKGSGSGSLPGSESGSSSGQGSPSYGDKPSTVSGGSGGKGAAKPSYTGAVYTGAASSLTSSAVLLGAVVLAALCL